MVTPVTIPLPRLGIDLLADETKLRAGAVRQATNVDIDKSGQFRRRTGWHTTHAADGWVALRSFDGRLVAQRGREVLVLDAVDLSEQVACDVGLSDPVDFCEYNDRLYFTNRHGLWSLRAGAVVAQRAGVRVPALPDVSGLPGPDARQFTVAVSLVNESGEESPAYVAGRVQSTGRVLLESVPMLPGMRWRVYVTAPDGDVLYLADEFDAVWSSYAVDSYPEGAQCQTLNRDTMPGGDFVRGWAGRLYVVRGDVLLYSDAMRPHLYAPQHNFIPFVGQIRFVEFVSGGVFVGDSRGVWWLAGSDPQQWRAELVSRAQAVARSSVKVPSHAMGALGSRDTRDVAVWLSTEGHMVGLGDGSVVALNAERVFLAPDQTGRSVYLERDGVAQIITLTAGGPAHYIGAAIDTRGKQ